MIKIGWQEILDLCLGKSSIKKVLSKDINDNNELIFVSLKDANIICDSKTYNNQKQFPENVLVELDGNILVENRDYIIKNNIGWTNAGIYELKIEGIDPYRKSALFKFIINKITPTLINPIANTQLEYNGNNLYLVNKIGKPIIGIESSFTSIVSILNSNWKPYTTTSNQDSEYLEVNIAAGNTDGRSTITVSLGSGINHRSSVRSFTVIVGNSGGGSGSGSLNPDNPLDPIDLN